MSTIEIVKAWKDEEYRDTLTEEQRGRLPQNPAGAIEVPDFTGINMNPASIHIHTLNKGCTKVHQWQAAGIFACCFSL